MSIQKLESGQALTELIIVFPIFLAICAGFIALFSQQSRRHFDKSSNVAIAAAKNPVQASDAVFNSWKMREDATGLENGKFPDVANVQNGTSCNGKAAFYSTSWKRIMGKQEVTSATCAPRNGYEAGISLAGKGSIKPLIHTSEAIYAPPENITQQFLQGLPLSAFFRFPPSNMNFVHTHFMNPMQHPIKQQTRITYELNTTAQLSACLAELCSKSGPALPVCMAAGGAALLANRIAKAASPRAFCPVLTQIVEGRYAALKAGWKARLTTLPP